MKTLVLLLLTISTLLVHGQYGMDSKRKYNSAQLIDSNSFKTDLVTKAELRSAFDQLKKDSISAVYRYSFAVNKTGKVIPIKYLDKKVKDLGKIQQFVVTTFNKYKWRAGHKTNCLSCRLVSYLQLSIIIETDENDIYISIEDVMLRSKIFYRKIAYKDL